MPYLCHVCKLVRVQNMSIYMSYKYSLESIIWLVNSTIHKSHITGMWVMGKRSLVYRYRYKAIQLLFCYMSGSY